jgi:restriction endonuclease S subunit
MGNDWSKQALPDCVWWQEGPGIRSYQQVKRGVPFVTIRSLQDRALIVPAMRHIQPELAHNEFKHFLLEKSDILLSCSGTIGKTAWVEHDNLPCLLNTGVIRLRPTISKIQARYLFYYMQSTQFQQQLQQWANGSVQKNIGSSHLKHMHVHFPSAVHQQRIVSQFQSIEAKLAMAHKRNHTIRLALSSFLHHVCSNKPTMPLAGICEIAVGGHWGKAEADHWHTEKAYSLKGIDIDKCLSKGYANITQRWISKQSAEERALDPCSIVIASSGKGQLGNNLWASNAFLKQYQLPIIYSNFCKRLKTEHAYQASYLHLWLLEQYHTNAFQPFITGTSVPNLYMADMLTYMRLPLLNTEEMTQLHTILDEYYNILFSSEIALLEQIYQHSLSVLFADCPA